MILYLKLTNFKQHESREFTFGPGLQLIKGENEAGKSGLLQAISYALLGARALPMPLAEIVTWGKPESTLRVELKFAHAGVEYSVYRQKSGAELRGGAIVASGHSEVTKFVEGLFGPSDVVNSLVIANQNKLRGTMVARASESTGLIEKLARFDLLDGIVTAIQTNFPTGSTNAVQAMLTNESAMPVPAEPDLSELDLALELELGKLSALKSELGSEKAQLAQINVNNALHTLQQAESHKQAIAQAENLLQQAEGQLAVIGNPKPPSEEEYEKLADDEIAYSKAVADYNAYLDFSKAEREINKLQSVWLGTLQSLEAHQAHINLQASKLRTMIEAMSQDIGVRRGAIIKAGECSFCGKLLDDVPEVQSLNTRLNDEIEELQRKLTRAKAEAAELAQESANLQLIKQTNLFVESLKLPETLIESTDQVPPKLVGPSAVPNKPVLQNFAARRKDLQDRATAATAAVARRSMLEGKMSASAAVIVATQDSLNALDIVGAKQTLQKAKEVDIRIDSLAGSVSRKEESVNALRARRSAVIAEFNAAKLEYSKSLARREEYKKTIAEMDLNNGVVKKIREVRPEVAARLWRMVLSTVNHYFSKVRGTASVVTRGESGFLVDGRPAEGLSGSAQDALGLAERMALTKTFLPNAGFLVLDEPAAAASDARESNMLATLAGAGFDQVIMVSHSNLADAFAAAIVEI